MHNSIFRLLRNVPLSRDYTDTVIFSTVSEQTTFFTNKVAYSFTDLMYITKNTILIPNQAGQYRNCNYVMYQNPDYPDKWFYAFIINVDYVADGTTRVDFVEDFYQTWMFQMTIKECFVEREHVNDDRIGANLKDEGLALGEYVVNRDHIVSFNKWWIVVVSSLDLSFTSNYPPAEGSLINGVYSGLEYSAHDSRYYDRIQEKLDDLASEGKSDAIVSIYMVPEKVLSDSQADGGLIDPRTTAELIQLPFAPSTMQGYTPKNNKLYIYPYRALKVSNNAGQAETLKFEKFQNVYYCNLMWIGTATPSGRILCYPINYEGVLYNHDYTITLSNYPQCSWLKDVYSNWLATESIRYGYQTNQIRENAGRRLLGAGAKSVAGALTLNWEMYGSGIGDMIMNQVDLVNNLDDAANTMSMEMEVHSIIPPSVNGSIGNDATLMSIGAYSIVTQEVCLTAEYLKSIDEYFSMFGYRVDRVKVPNLFGRHSWNYVKCINPIVTGTAPVYAIDNLKKLLMNGIRFWHGDYVGDFSRNNNIINTEAQGGD